MRQENYYYLAFLDTKEYFKYSAEGFTKHFEYLTERFGHVSFTEQNEMDRFTLLS